MLYVLAPLFGSNAVLLFRLLEQLFGNKLHNGLSPNISQYSLKIVLSLESIIIDLVEGFYIGLFIYLCQP